MIRYASHKRAFRNPILRARQKFFSRRLEAETAWNFILALRSRLHYPLDVSGAWVSFNRDGQLITGYGTGPGIGLRVEPTGAWCWTGPPGPPVREAAELFSLFLPLIAGWSGRCLVIGQLGQSLDGRIAIINGNSHYITGPTCLDHLHRLRALSDAVLIGTTTAALDNPRLTVRRVTGPNPLRIVIDLAQRLPDHLHLFCDQTVDTVRVVDGNRTLRLPNTTDQGYSRWHNLPLIDANEPTGLSNLLVILAQEWQARWVLVEGGGITVSKFLAAGLLQRLHLSVAPLILGSGHMGITLTEITDLQDGLRPRARSFMLGRDILWDLDLS